jgi:tRNA G10  N-methylase Trm11
LGAPIINDPRSSSWIATVRALPDEVRIEWTPRLADPRFAYRRADVAAASHPTLAAALVRVSDPREDDVVWDPFVGSGLELCERHVFGPSRELVGTDVDDTALDRARQNLASVGATASLFRAGAGAFQPDAPVDAIITNPPMGRRVLEGHDIAGMLAEFVRRAPAVLGPRGRLVWMSPTPRATRDAARAAGLRLTRSSEVDMGGFFAELQRFDLP